MKGKTVEQLCKISLIVCNLKRGCLRVFPLSTLSPTRARKIQTKKITMILISERLFPRKQKGSRKQKTRRKYEREDVLRKREDDREEKALDYGRHNR